jgi:hypothetical protein
MFDKPRKIQTQAEADNIFRGTIARDVMILQRCVVPDSFQPYYLIALRLNIGGIRETCAFLVPLEFMPYKRHEMYDIQKWNFDTGLSVRQDEVQELAKVIF